MYELSIVSHFASAHFLRGYDGPCKNLHGHTWKIEVVISGTKLNEMGMLVDFKGIKQKLTDFLGNLDHACLNELPEFKEKNPTTENIAQYIYKVFSKECAPLNLVKVKVWESDSASVTYSE